MNDQLLSQLTGIPIAQINTYTPQQRQMAVGMAYDKSGMLKPADRIQGIPTGTFDPEEGMYDAYISQRDAFLGNAQGRQRNKLLKKFNKSFDENWKSTEDMRRNEFEWNRDISDLNSRFNSITQRIKDQTAASVQGIQNSLNSRQPIQQTPQQPAEQPKAKVKQNTPQAPAGTTTRIINGQEYSVAPDFEEMPGKNNYDQKQETAPKQNIQSSQGSDFGDKYSLDFNTPFHYWGDGIIPAVTKSIGHNVATHANNATRLFKDSTNFLGSLFFGSKPFNKQG